MTLYVRGAGMSLARIEVDTVALTYTRTYLHPDQLGSATAGTSQSGAVLWREQYAPYGDKLTAPTANDDLGSFTGHIDDDATTDMNLTYMQARYYDPGAGRFASVDPVTFMDTGTPGMVNRYAYTMGDPVNMIDPDGRLQQDIKTPFSHKVKLAGQGALIGFAVANGGTVKGDMANPAALNANDAQALGAGLAVGGILGSVLGSKGGGSAKTLGAAARNGAKGTATIANEVPSTLARVVPRGVSPSTLAAPNQPDAFVTAADDIAGMSANQISEALTIPSSSSGFNVIEFPSAGQAIASPVNRSNPGFVSGGRTAGGAREFVVPNQSIPNDAIIREVD